MNVTQGYRDLKQPLRDCNIYTHPQPNTQAVTRVIPDCGHTYFIAGHASEDSPTITERCCGCEAQDALRDARRQLAQVRDTNAQARGQR